MKLKDEVAIVTGGASGIGRAAAIGLAKEGASVAVADLDLNGAARTVQMIEQLGRKATPIKVDVSDKDQTDEMARKTIEAFGRIDILVTSAAVLEETSMEELTKSQWDNTIGINLTGVLYSTQSVLATMKEQQYGKVVIISSIAAFRGRALQSAYCTAAGSLTAFAANTAVQMGKHGIYVNCIAPGIIDTDFAEALKEKPDYLAFRRSHTPLGRVGKPEDIAGPVVFLASHDSDFVTGETLVVDGGISIYTNGYGL